jgi:phospholipid transport system substrate-binding protein
MKTGLFLLLSVVLSIPTHAWGSRLDTGPSKDESADAASPLAALKRTDAQLRAAPGTAQMRRIVQEFFDYDDLARRSLGKTWDSLTPVQRKDFTDTLHALIEKSFLKGIGGKTAYHVRFDREERNGSGATVFATLVVDAQGEKIEVHLEYQMHRKNGRWVLDDLITDDESMVKTYRANFGRIISQESFDELLKRMKKKLDASNAPPAPAGEKLGHG